MVWGRNTDSAGALAAWSGGEFGEGGMATRSQGLSASGSGRAYEGGGVSLGEQTLGARGTTILSFLHELTIMEAETCNANRK
jgi:hypothetical protein